MLTFQTSSSAVQNSLKDQQSTCRDVRQPPACQAGSSPHPEDHLQQPWPVSRLNISVHCCLWLTSSCDVLPGEDRKRDRAQTPRATGETAAAQSDGAENAEASSAAPPSPSQPAAPKKRRSASEAHSGARAGSSHCLSCAKLPAGLVVTVLTSNYLECYDW